MENLTSVVNHRGSLQLPYGTLPLRCECSPPLLEYARRITEDSPSSVALSERSEKRGRGPGKAVKIMLG